MTKNFGKNAQTIGLMALGNIAQKAVRNRLAPMIPVVKDQPILRAGLPVILGLYMMDSKNDMISDAGAGMAAGALSDYAAQMIPAIGDIAGDEFATVADDLLSGTMEALEDDLSGDVLEDDLSGTMEALEDDLSGDVLEDDLSDDMSDDMGDDMGDDF